LIPGVLSDETSALTDSFQDGLLSVPSTQDPDYKGWKVPEVLTSGNFAKIGAIMAYEHTKTRRPDLLDE
jgi:tRNA (guanine37-N1)-methyltransferase